MAKRNIGKATKYGDWVAPADPLSCYQPANRDETGSPCYYGYIDAFGSWCIMQDDGINGITKFAFGTKDYTDYWDAKADLTYEYFNVAINADQQELPG